MSHNCTILCPTDDSKQIIALVRQFVGERGSVAVTGEDAAWSSLVIETPSASLVLNRLVRVRPGDRFSKLVLGVHNYFNQVKTRHNAIKAAVLRRVEEMALAIGVVAEPEFVESAGHYDLLFGLTEALDAIIWTGSGVINANGELLLNGEGDSEIAG